VESSGAGSGGSVAGCGALRTDKVDLRIGVEVSTKTAYGGVLRGFFRNNAWIVIPIYNPCMAYAPRALEGPLRALATKYPIVTVTGPRQSGKSTLCRHVFADKPYINLEALDQRAFARDDPRGFLASVGDGAILDDVDHGGGGEREGGADRGVRRGGEPGGEATGGGVAEVGGRGAGGGVDRSAAEPWVSRAGLRSGVQPQRAAPALVR